MMKSINALSGIHLTIYLIDFTGMFHFYLKQNILILYLLPTVFSEVRYFYIMDGGI